MNIAQKEVGQIHLYGCGGAGTNIAMRLKSIEPSSRPVGFGDLKVTILDTSKSNLRNGTLNKEVYLVRGLDGAGQMRADSHPEVAACVRDMLQEYPPAGPQGLSIVVSSGGGGSGSVIGPEIMSELLARDEPALAILIGDTSTSKYTDNTFRTLLSYGNIAKSRQAPVVLAYFEIGRDGTRGEIDGIVEQLIIRLTGLFSRENNELDSRDLYNWLRYDRPLRLQPGLVQLSVIDARSSEHDDLGHVLSVATLAAEGADTTFAHRPDYQVIGFLPEGIAEATLKASPTHFVVSTGLLAEHSDRLEKLTMESESRQAARVNRNSALTKTYDTTSSGVVL